MGVLAYVADEMVAAAISAKLPAHAQQVLSKMPDF